MRSSAGETRCGGAWGFEGVWGVLDLQGESSRDVVQDERWNCVARMCGARQGWACRARLSGVFEALQSGLQRRSVSEDRANWGEA